MGCCFSCTRSSSTSEENLKMIRIIHSNGYIEHLAHPVSVAQVTGKPPQHMLFTHAQLLVNASTPLKPDVLLEAGRVYFMLPHSLFSGNVSPDELAPMVRKLTALAKTSKSKGRVTQQNLTCLTSPDRKAVDDDRAAKRKAWKPILSMVREISFTRGGESDLQRRVE